ncbi:hypothetical protein [Hymenobacter canadensis]|uniref:DUF2798 domain-containing protein n=1 Tax=Hymenobacter canadensis TaxID=2999067 RepID=A0ABY7LMD7_9BACT|nr:hypothetical protein [Hymenobacter canadensis]WBA40612.1 hypothetical protein O3303_12340 [Hymenobacter canadensis]
MLHPSLSTFFSTRLLRRAGIMAGVSFGLALALVGYLFGFADEDFFSRLFNAFFVFFWLLSVTFLAVVPFVSWAAAKWLVSPEVAPAAGASRKPRSAPASATVRKPTRTVTRSEKTL